MRSIRSNCRFRLVRIAALTGCLTVCAGISPGFGQQRVQQSAAVTQSVSSPNSSSAPAAAVSPTEDFERRIGPLHVKGKSFTVALQLRRFQTQPSEETVVRMEIRDDIDAAAFDESFASRVEDDHFVDTMEVSARELAGTRGSGLLVTYDQEPSTPLGGASYQVFGMFNGKLVPFGKPILLEGNLVQPEPAPEKVVKTSNEPGLEGDMLRFRVWTSNVFVFIPVKVDWFQAKLHPGWRCQKMTSRGWLPICVFEVQAERVTPRDEMTFVRLLPDYFEPEATAQHAVVTKMSRVEILKAAGILLWTEVPDVINVGVANDLWLKVRIDDKEGWIHTQEDFNAIGLPQAG